MLHLKWQKKEISKKILGGLLSLLFFNSYTLSSPLKVAILDTGFCVEQLKSHKNLTINKSEDLTKSNNFKCNTLDKKSRRLHGNWVLSQFISQINKELQVEVSPFVVFDKNAKQDTKAWIEAIKRQDQFHLLIIAAGIRDTQKLNLIKVKTPTFVAGATIGRGISYKTILWPQNQFKNSRVFTIGSYSEKNEDLPARPDYTLINSSEMKYFFSGGSSDDSFSGTSRATATAAARAINHCYISFITKTSIVSCLKKKAETIELLNDTEKIQVPTY